MKFDSAQALPAVRQLQVIQLAPPVAYVQAAGTWLRPSVQTLPIKL